MFKAFFYFLRECWSLNWKFPMVLLMNELVAAALSVSLAVLPKFVIDAIFVQQNRQQSLIWIAIVLGSQFVLYMLRQIFFRLDYTTSNKTWHLYELKLAERMLNAKYEAIERQEFLDLHQKAARYVAGFGAGFGAVLRQGFQILGQLVTLIGLAAIIFTLHPIVIMALVAIVVVQTILLNKGLKPVRNFQIDQSVIERRADYFNKRINDFQYGKEIRNYNLNKWFLGKFKEQLARVFEFYKKIGNANLKLGFYSISGLVLQLFVSYYYLFRQSFLGLVTVGSFTMYLSAISTFFDTLSQIIMNVLQINQFKVLFKAYKEYMDYPIEQLASDIKPELPAVFDIEFRNVSFKYGTSEKYALRNINVKLNSKERIAIIGENGAGKSTFVKLLMRLYEPTEGTILLNGVDIKTIDYEHYQSFFAAVFQDFKLFSFTIRENITFDTDTTSERKKDLKKIVNATGLDKVVAKLSKGLDTTVYRDFDDAGFTPSGGEGQKIAIARAAYKNAPIVILDEPTAALDPISESQIYEQFNQFFSDKCSLYISHRMAVTKFSDRTLVFDNAQIVQDGNHEDLMNQNGKYRELYELQAQYYN